MADKTGKVIQIIGPVVDVRFPPEALPEIRDAVEVFVEYGEEKRRIVLEVAQDLGNDTVRCVAMSSTDGLRRGAEVTDTGEPISVPVGPKVLGRLLNVLGEAIDELGPVETDQRLPIHRPAPSFEDQ